MNWLETPHGSFPNFVLRLCQILKPYHGYGGLGFAESSDIGIADKVQPLIYSLARRFPGLEVDRPLLHIRYVSKGIKGVNWLTILGPRWVDAMGGVTRLRESLSELFVFYEYDGSLHTSRTAAPAWRCQSTTVANLVCGACPTVEANQDQRTLQF